MIDVSKTERGVLVEVGPFIVHGGLTILPAQTARFLAADGDDIWVRYDMGSTGTIPAKDVHPFEATERG